VEFARARTKRRHLEKWTGGIGARDPRYIRRTTEGCEQAQKQQEPASGTAQDQRYIRRTSQEPAVLRDTCTRTDQSSAGVCKGASAQVNRTFGEKRGTSKRGGIQGRPIAEGQTYEEVAFSRSKGGGAFWILQSKRSEHPFGGTVRHGTVQGQQRDKRPAPRLANLRTPDKDTHRVKKGVFETLM
jgi:hypothetical protein